jgi:hypothetical protein
VGGARRGGGFGGGGGGDWAGSRSRWKVENAMSTGVQAEQEAVGLYRISHGPRSIAEMRDEGYLPPINDRRLTNRRPPPPRPVRHI